MMEEPQGTTESEICNLIGWTIIILGFLTGFVFILVFGRVDVPMEIAGAYLGTRSVWSGTMICVGVGIVVNGFLFGYLFQKIASILKYHESKR